MGKLIVIEGTDSSGKETQTRKIYEKLESEGYLCKKISFPNYESEASQPVKMYLSGKFGKEASKVNPYPISTMYAIDRYASYKENWEKDYKADKIIIADRYTTSNIVHQASKFDNFEDKENYINWLEDLEYEKMELPRPDLVIFLNMPTNKALELISKRNNKITGEDKKDIHEKDKDYLEKSHKNACDIAERLKWKEIHCVNKNGEIKSIDEIHEEVYNVIKKVIS